MLQISKILFDNWNNAGVRYCHWKSNEHLMEGLDGDTDLDVFVLPEDKNIAEEMLKKSACIKFRTQKGSVYPLVDEWIGFDDVTGKLIHVHLHYRIITGTKFCKEYCFPINDAVIESRYLDPETQVYLVAPEIEIIILYCRVALKAKNKSKISSKEYDAEIAYLKERVDWDKIKTYCQDFLGAEGEHLFALICRESLDCKEWREVLKCAKAWLTPSQTISSWTCWWRTHYHWYRFLTLYILNKKFGKHHILRKTLIPRGTSICFLGQDGSGKSTVSKIISKWLDWKIANHNFYLGSGEHYHNPVRTLLNWGNKLRRKLHPVPTQTVAEGTPKPSKKGPTRKSTKGVAAKIGMLLSCYDFNDIVNSAYNKVRSAKKYMNKGGIAIYDRFPQAQFPGLYDGPKLVSLYGDGKTASGIAGIFARKEIRTIEKIQGYQPDLIFKLVLPAEESIRRKPFENYDDVKMKEQITEQLEFPHSAVHKIDATQDFDQEILEIKRIIWQHLLALQS